MKPAKGTLAVHADAICEELLRTVFNFGVRGIKKSVTDGWGDSYVQPPP